MLRYISCRAYHKDTRCLCIQIMIETKESRNKLKDFYQAILSGKKLNCDKKKHYNILVSASFWHYLASSETESVFFRHFGQQKVSTEAGGFIFLRILPVRASSESRGVILADFHTQQQRGKREVLLNNILILARKLLRSVRETSLYNIIIVTTRLASLEDIPGSWSAKMTPLNSLEAVFEPKSLESNAWRFGRHFNWF